MEDFKSALNEMKITCNEEEFKGLGKMVDANKNGYIDYQEFAKVFNERNLEALANPNAPLLTVIPTADSNKHEQFLYKTNTNFATIKTNNDFEFSTLKTSTRFSSTPTLQNTFMNYRHSDQVDYTRGLNSKVQYQKDDKEYRQRHIDQKAQTIRDNQKMISQRIEESSYKKTILDSQKIQSHINRINQYNCACKIQMEL